MKVFTPAFLLMAFATSRAVAAPTAEAEGLETRADYCIDVKICHGYNFDGGCYKECKRPKEVHRIRSDYRQNVGSVKIGSKNWECTFGSNGHPDTATLPLKYPGTKKLPEAYRNNLSAYQCNKV